MKLTIKKLANKKDERGSLYELFSQKEVGKLFGHLLLTTILPGKIKGKHFHKRKKEWYCVLSGNAKLTVINNKTKEIKMKVLKGESMQLITIYPHHYHEIRNIGKTEVLLLVYHDEPFNKKDPDTYRLE